MTNIILIAAHDKLNGIGLNGKIPWHLPEDLKRFKRITQNETVVMGRKTLESLCSPLKNRENWVLSKSLHNTENKQIRFFDKVTSVLEACKEQKKSNLFIIGGQQIYEAFLPYATHAELTIVEGDYDVDTHFPNLNQTDWLEIERSTEQVNKKGVKFRYMSFVKK